MSTHTDAKREAGAAIRASVPKHETRFPRMFHPEEIREMPRLKFSEGCASGVFISNERDGGRFFSQGMCYHEPDMDDLTWQATSWDEAFLCVKGKLHVIVHDRDDNKIEFHMEPGDHFWAPAGYRYTLRATGVDSLNYWTTSPQPPDGWRYTGDDASYSDFLISDRRVAQPQA
jgi:mannose-6-phosphate isomerase-like protein (cupin superfamily)